MNYKVCVVLYMTEEVRIPMMLKKYGKTVRF